MSCGPSAKMYSQPEGFLPQFTDINSDCVCGKVGRAESWGRTLSTGVEGQG